jgi:hypothetical protein
MPNDVFNIATDLSIRYFNSTLSAYVDIVADSFEVEIDRGIDIDNGVLAKATIATATIKLVKHNLSDFLGTPGYKASDPIEIRYKPYPDSVSFLYNPLFIGNIQNVSMGYINESKTLEITITADDPMRKFQNTVLASYSVTGTVAQRSYRNCMTNLATALGTSLSAGGSGAAATTQRSFTWINTTGGEIASKFLDAELGWVYSTNNGGLSYLTRSDVATKQAISFVPGSQATASNVHYTDIMTIGQFEVNVAGWNTVPNYTVTRDTSIFYKGIASMKGTYTGTATNFYTETGYLPGVIASSKYKASMRVRSANTGLTTIRVGFHDAAFQPLTSYESPQVAIDDTSWKEVSITIDAPATAAYFSVAIAGFSSGSNGKIVYMDDVKMENLTNISNNHYCLDNIVLDYDSDTLVNKCVVVDGTALTRTVASNTASISANGEQSGTFTVDLDPAGASTYAQWASEVVNSSTIKQVTQVTVPVIRDDGKAGTIADLETGSTLQVEFAQDPLPPLQAVSLVRRINHVITPQHWEMNIGLWRGM